MYLFSKSINFFISAFLILLSTFAVGQNKKTIDSLNAIPFPTKIAKASELLDVYQKNLSDAKKLNYQIGIGESYSNLALVNFYQGQLEKDIKYSLQAISVFEKANEREQLAREYGELGHRMRRRDVKKAEFYILKAIKIAEAGKFNKPLLAIYDNFGKVKEKMNQNDSALYYYKKSLKMKQDSNDRVGIPYSLNHIAEFYINQNDFPKAKILFAQALKLRIELKDEIGVAENYCNLGELLLLENKPKEALLNFELSLTKSIKCKYADLTQYNYNKIADCYEKLGNYREAFSNFKLYSTYKDSILNQKRNDKIAELEIKFEASEKEKQLLESQAETKQRNSTIIMIIFITLFIIIISLSIIRQQKLKNKQEKQEFQLKNAITKIETQNKLQKQRLAISRDLHDNIGAQLTFIISSIDNIKYAFPIKDLNLNQKLNSINDFTKATILELRDTIWAMNSNEITFDDLQSRILNFIENAQQFQENIQFTFNIDQDLKDLKLSSTVGMNLYRTIQEAVNNAIKHAKASKIAIDIDGDSKILKIYITDDGKGFTTEEIEKGNGLLNMEKRIEEIGGTIQFISEKGTQIFITLKI